MINIGNKIIKSICNSETGIQHNIILKLQSSFDCTSNIYYKIHENIWYKILEKIPYYDISL